MKQSYTRPEVSRVELVLDQQVLTACKTVGAHSAILSGGVDCDYAESQGGDCLTTGS